MWVKNHNLGTPPTETGIFGKNLFNPYISNAPVQSSLARRPAWRQHITVIALIVPRTKHVKTKVAWYTPIGSQKTSICLNTSSCSVRGVPSILGCTYIGSLDIGAALYRRSLYMDTPSLCWALYRGLPIYGVPLYRG